MPKSSSAYSILKKKDFELANSLLRQMAFSSSKIEYQEIQEKFVRSMPDEHKGYFNPNWHSQRQYWAGFSVIGTFLYGETTNNKLESKNVQIKKLID